MNKPATPLFSFIQRHRYQIALVVIVLIAIFFRYYELSKLPPGLHPDEAANGLDVVQRIFHGDIRPLYNTNGPRESLFFFFQAIFVATIGNTILALRIAPATFGVLTVLATYYWTRRLWAERVALLSAFYVAVSFWAVVITRDGFRASMSPLLVMTSMWMLTLAYQTKKIKWYAMAGLSMGIGMYTYLNFKLFPLVPIFLCGVAWWRARKDGVKLWPRYKKQLTVLLAVFALTISWMAVFAVKHPADVFARAGGVSFLEPSLNHGHPIQTLADSMIKTALMFNVAGDQNYRQNLGGYPELSFFVGIMFILGLILALINIRKTRYLALLTVFVVMLLPEALTAEGIPHALRAIGAMPATMILAAIGTSYMLERWYLTFPVNSAARSTGLTAILILLAMTGYQSYQEYFVAWAQSPQTYQAYAEDGVAVAKYLNSDSFNGPKYAVIDGYTDKTIQYLTYGHSTYTRIDPSDIAHLSQNGPKQFLVSEQSKEEALKDLRQRYPKARIFPELSDFNQAELFVVYEVRS